MVEGAHLALFGTWERQVTRVDGGDAEVVDPDDVDVLSNTGAEITPGLVIGGSLLVSGLALGTLLAVQRRHRERDEASTKYE